MSIACTVLYLANVLQVQSVAMKIEAVLEAAAKEKDPRALMFTEDRGFIFPEFTIISERRKVISQCVESICDRSFEEVLAASKLADSAFRVKDAKVYGAYFHPTYSLIALGIYGFEKTARIREHIDSQIAFCLIEDVVSSKLKPAKDFPFSRGKDGHLELKPIQVGYSPNCSPSSMTGHIIHILRLFDANSGGPVVLPKGGSERSSEKKSAKGGITGW